MRTDPLEPLPYEHDPDPVVWACQRPEDPMTVDIDIRCPGCRCSILAAALRNPVEECLTNKGPMLMHVATRRALEAHDEAMVVHFDREMARRWPELVGAR